MDFYRYLEESELTERKFPDGLYLSRDQAELLHAVMGLCTESGEAMDQLKKHLIYGASLDLTNLTEELGDKLWYIAIICRKFGISLEEIMEANIRKLRARYPEGFNKESALNRDTDNELKALKGDPLNPVVYFKEDPEPEVDIGYTTPGWYFWNETWQHVYGPYPSYGVAHNRCQDYAANYVSRGQQSKYEGEK